VRFKFGDERSGSLQVVAGQTAALALKKVKRNQVRKGMVLVDARAEPKASWEFDADIAILTHSTTIQPRYQVCYNQSVMLQPVSHAAVIAIGLIRALLQCGQACQLKCCHSAPCYAWSVCQQVSVHGKALRPWQKSDAERFYMIAGCHPL